MYGMYVVDIINSYVINDNRIFIGIKLNAKMMYEIRKRYGEKGEVLYFDVALSKTHSPMQMCKDGYFLMGIRHQKAFSIKMAIKLKALSREYK